MQNKKILLYLIIVLLSIAAIWIVIEYTSINPLEGERITRKDITAENLEGYDFFYSNQFIDRDQNEWFDLLYEDCKINELENTITISILIYPKYKDSIEFVLYPIISDELAQLTQTGISELQINQPVVIDESKEFNGYGFGWDVGLIPAETRKQLGVTDDEILKLASTIKARLIVNGKEVIVSLKYYKESM